MKKDTDNTIAHMYLVPHFHYDVAWIHTEEEKRGASLVKQFCDKARSDPQFKFILDQVPLLQAFMCQYPEGVSYLRQLTHGKIISLIDKDNEKRDIIGAGRYGNQLICQEDNGDEYEYCLGPVLGTRGDYSYSCTLKMYKGPVIWREQGGFCFIPFKISW